MNTSGIESPSMMPRTVRPNRMVFMSKLASVPRAAAPIKPHTPSCSRQSTACLKTCGDAVVSMEKILKSPVMFLGLSLPEHGYHAPNENYDWQQACGGMVAFGKYFENVAAL